MKKLAVIIGGFSLASTGSALAAIDCTPTPSCASLGYSATSGSCSGDYLVCPFDTSKVHCINVPDQCSELGYTKVATNGNYTCSEGQTVSKCSKNTNKYKCEGTACYYGYYTSANMPECSYTYCCQKAQYDNTSCYTWIDNAAYKEYEEDYARCKAASQGVQEPEDCSYSYGNCNPKNQNGQAFYVKRRTSGGNSVDACGNAQYEYVSSTAYHVQQYNSYDRCSGNYDSSTPCCDWIHPSMPGYSYQQAGWQCDYYYSDTDSSPVCLSEYAWPHNYNFKGQSLTFTEYCYQKYNIWTNCRGLKFAGYDAIPYNWDHGIR